MPSQRYLFAQIIVLWLAVIVLAALTGLISGSSSKPVTFCGSSPFDNATSTTNSSASATSTSSTNSTISINCDFKNHVASIVYQRSSYFQAFHIIVIQAIAACCLASFKPVLLAMEWRRLASRTTIAALQSGMELTQSPGLSSALVHIMTSRSLHVRTFFVVVVAGLSIISPAAVSPIYRSHRGPYPASERIVIGGGVGPDTAPSFDTTGYVPVGVIVGRALLNSGTSAGSRVPWVSFNVSAAPFLQRDTVQDIWSASVTTVVAYNTLDCGPTAPARILPSGGDIVSFNTSEYFSNDIKTITPSIAGKTYGSMGNDPQVTTIYLNSSVTAKPGVVSATTSVVFLAANGTLEGAHQTIASPTTNTRITGMDVLVCTSKTKLVISKCTIAQGNVTKCTAVSDSKLPSGDAATGFVENYIHNPFSVAILLAASPVTAYYSSYQRLPTYDKISQDFIDSDIPPLSYLTFNTTSDPYNLPLIYVQNTLFGQTSQSLVQGLLTKWTAKKTIKFNLWATFGISNVSLLYVILGVAAICAIAATLWSTLLASSRHATTIDAARLVAISRNPNLDATFARYADRKIDIENGVLDSEVSYVWDERLGRHTLVLGNEPDNDSDTEEKRMTPDEPNAGMKGKDLEPLVWQ
ncbi:hypothetical protein CPB83DRAFT_856795 [Crepidotus variabilis]|uniref:Uncharacterized protein n=1 Tax=Crepidotus variabilis TaxID=179855 RepID=A0A9P6JNG7_9AGAR|nr:hypothetical protein CPB83DRAFT_856795 [Crepidotus variabilis]